MYDHILNALINIEVYLDNESYSVEIPNNLFKTDILLDYYYYPTHFVDVDDDEKEMIALTLADAGYTDHYDALAELLWKANIEPVPKTELTDGNNYCFIMISFGTAPIQAYLKAKKARYEQVTFFCTPYTNRQGYQRFKILVVPNKFGSIFEEMKHARSLEIDSEEKLDQTYWSLLEQAIGQICQSLSIEAAGFTLPEMPLKQKNLEAYSLYLEQFCQLTGIQNIEGFKARWIDIQQQQKQLIQQVKDEGFYGTVKPHFLNYRFLLCEYLTSTYEDHWQMDYEELVNYLAKYQDKPFEFNEEENLQLDELARKFETGSNYSLLDIETCLESYCFLPCLKTDVETVLSLAEILDFPIRKLGD
ncbi:DUF7821 domain-containing protein [Pasteurella canis]|uniref:DUF7821 domain-containing protein n=1 Tax=Pasteurella canis TaxID=753 RepID=UPI000D8BF2A5|nr:hypothetical protein [Pasteurella canis]SPY33083.1 Uncharacterised protein [Pasteurella canis]